ncbi:MAG: hypothetical protein U1G08_10415 [Verrucomicrobiota bacterium]
MSPQTAIRIAAAGLWIAKISAASPVEITLDTVPSDVTCGQPWAEQGIILQFTPTLESEGGTGGLCFFGVQAGSVDLYPGRLLLDLSTVSGRISRIEADVYDACGKGCTRLYSYAGDTVLGEAAVTSSGIATLALDFAGPAPDRCAIRSNEGGVFTVRIYTESATPHLAVATSGADIVLSWSASAGTYVLEKAGELEAQGDWTLQQEGITRVEDRIEARVPSTEGEQFFRLRSNY